MSTSETEYAETEWKRLSKSIDYFAPAIERIQEYTGLDKATLLRNMGKTLGEKFAAKNTALSFEDFLEELTRLWEKSAIGKIHIESRSPLIFTTSNGAVCGQLPEAGGLFKCAIHEGFFEAAHAAKIGRPIKIKQEVAYKAQAGTWSCRYTVERTIWPLNLRVLQRELS